MVDVNRFRWTDEDIRGAGNHQAGRKPSTTRRSEPASIPHHAKGERFVRGPIPFDWLQTALTFGGKSAKLAFAVWWLVGVKERTFLRVDPWRPGIHEQEIWTLDEWQPFGVPPGSITAVGPVPEPGDRIAACGKRLDREPVQSVVNAFAKCILKRIHPVAGTVVASHASFMQPPRELLILAIVVRTVAADTIEGILAKRPAAVIETLAFDLEDRRHLPGAPSPVETIPHASKRRLGRGRMGQK